MVEYRIINGAVLHEPTNRIIPNDPRNEDWQVYQKWLAAGNTPAAKFDASNVEEARDAKIREVRDEGLRRMQAIYPAISDIDELRLYRDMLQSIAPAALNLVPNLQTVSAIFQAGRDAIQLLRGSSDVVFILTYDPVSGPSWP